jgi:hypothetical protein
VGAVTRRESPDLGGLEGRVRALEAAVRESRQLHQRLCDIVDVVTEVLVPATDPDDARVRDALDRLRRTLGDGPGPEAQRSL